MTPTRVLFSILDALLCVTLFVTLINRLFGKKKESEERTRRGNRPEQERDDDTNLPWIHLCFFLSTFSILMLVLVPHPLFCETFGFYFFYQGAWLFNRKKFAGNKRLQSFFDSLPIVFLVISLTIEGVFFVLQGPPKLQIVALRSVVLVLLLAHMVLYGYFVLKSFSSEVTDAARANSVSDAVVMLVLLSLHAAGLLILVLNIANNQKNWTSYDCQYDLCFFSVIIVVDLYLFSFALWMRRQPLVPNDGLRQLAWVPKCGRLHYQVESCDICVAPLMSYEAALTRNCLPRCLRVPETLVWRERTQALILARVHVLLGVWSILMGLAPMVEGNHVLTPYFYFAIYLTGTTVSWRNCGAANSIPIVGLVTTFALFLTWLVCSLQFGGWGYGVEQLPLMYMMLALLVGGWWGGMIAALTYAACNGFVIYLRSADWYTFSMVPRAVPPATLGFYTVCNVFCYAIMLAVYVTVQRMLDSDSLDWKSTDSECAAAPPRLSGSSSSKLSSRDQTQRDLLQALKPKPDGIEREPKESNVVHVVVAEDKRNGRVSRSASRKQIPAHGVGNLPSRNSRDPGAVDKRENSQDLGQGANGSHSNDGSSYGGELHACRISYTPSEVKEKTIKIDDRWANPPDAPGTPILAKSKGLKGTISPSSQTAPPIKAPTLLGLMREAGGSNLTGRGLWNKSPDPVPDHGTRAVPENLTLTPAAEKRKIEKSDSYKWRLSANSFFQFKLDPSTGQPPASGSRSNKSKVSDGARTPESHNRHSSSSNTSVFARRNSNSSDKRESFVRRRPSVDSVGSRNGSRNSSNNLNNSEDGKMSQQQQKTSQQPRVALESRLIAAVRNKLAAAATTQLRMPNSESNRASNNVSLSLDAQDFLNTDNSDSSPRSPRFAQPPTLQLPPLPPPANPDTPPRKSATLSQGKDMSQSSSAPAGQHLKITKIHLDVGDLIPDPDESHSHASDSADELALAQFPTISLSSKDLVMEGGQIVLNGVSYHVDDADLWTRRDEGESIHT
eukprot:g51865.t1